MLLGKKIIQIFTADLLALQWTLGWAALITALIFILGANPSINLEFAGESDSLYIWSIVFFLMGVFHIAGCFFRISNFIRINGHVISMYVWSYILMIFTVYSPLIGTELLFLIPWFCEFWVFTNILARSMRKGIDGPMINCRRSDD
jgi:hypothetical protein